MIPMIVETLRFVKLILNCFIYWSILGIISNKNKKYIILSILIVFGFYEKFLPRFIRYEFFEDLSFSIVFLIKNQTLQNESKFSNLEIFEIIIFRILGDYFLNLIL